MHLSFLQAAARNALLIACLLLATACKKAEPEYAPSLERAALMHLLFPTWKSYGPDLIQTVDLTATTGAHVKEKENAIRAQVAPLYVVKLDKEHAALITQVLRVGEDGQAYACHACSGEIGAYFFELVAEGWRLTSRQDSVTRSGAYGHIGKTEVFKLGEGQFAVTSEETYCGQGYCETGLAFVGLTAGRANKLNPIILIAADNDGFKGSCSALDNPTVVEPDDVDENDDCIEIRGSWKLQGKQLLVSFEGRLNMRDKNGQPTPTQNIQQKAVYEVSATELKLVSGQNPIPRS